MPKLLRSIIDGIQEKKGREIVVINLQSLSDRACDYMVIAEGNTLVQLRAIVDSVWDEVFLQTKEKPLHVHEGGGEWIAIDYGNIIVHLFLPAVRSFYKIEQLWSDADQNRIPNID